MGHSLTLVWLGLCPTLCSSYNIVSAKRAVSQIPSLNTAPSTGPTSARSSQHSHHKVSAVWSSAPLPAHSSPACLHGLLTLKVPEASSYFRPLDVLLTLLASVQLTSQVFPQLSLSHGFPDLLSESCYSFFLFPGTSFPPSVI